MDVLTSLGHADDLIASGDQLGGDLKLGVLRKQSVDWTASIQNTQEQAQYLNALEGQLDLDKLFHEAPASEPPKLEV